MLPLTATISFTVLSAPPVTYTFPLPSTATSVGTLKPLPRVLIVGEAGMLPLTARISFTALLKASAM